MPKLKLRIDLDIDFSVSAMVDAFGFEAVVAIRRKKAAGEISPKLEQGDTVELAPEDYTELIPEKPTTPEQ
jgi:hypothetical protein